MTWNKLIKITLGYPLILFIVLFAIYSWMTVSWKELYPPHSFLEGYALVTCAVTILYPILWFVIKLVVGDFNHILAKPIIKQKPTFLKSLEHHLAEAKRSNDTEEIERLTNSINIYRKWKI